MEIFVGFKLKGFRNRFDRLVGVAALGDDQFLHIMRAIENICSEIGHNLIKDASRRGAYKAVYDLAANDNVRLNKRELKVAA